MTTLARSGRSGDGCSIEVPAAEEVGDMCACGCGAEVTDSMYWATEICQLRWMSRRVAQPAEPATVRAFGGGLTYTDEVVRVDD
jgi:hypothetical protein